MKKQVQWGIYAWVHLPTDRTYVGQTGPTNGLRRRKNSHLSELRRGVHHARYLQNAWNKYGESEFEFVVLEDMTNGDIGQLTTREQFWMDATESVFNSAPAAGSLLGYEHSQESRSRQSELGRQRWQDPEYRVRMSEAAVRRSQSLAYRASQSAAQRGQKRSAATCQNISDSLRGKPLTPEHCANMSAAQLKRFEDPQAHAKLREGAKHRPPMSEETRRKHGEGNRRRGPLSAETKAKIRTSHLARNATKRGAA